MAIGKKTGGRDFAAGNRANPAGRPRIPDDIKAMLKLNHLELSRILNHVVFLPMPEIKALTKSDEAPAFLVGAAKLVEKFAKYGDVFAYHALLDRMIGRSRESEPRDVTPPPALTCATKKSLTEVIVAAGYPPPYPKQIEMVDFLITQCDPRLLLGARGYGKTDYGVIGGLAYEMYCEGATPEASTLIVTKSKERNAAILAEIAHVAKSNGVIFELENSTSLRVAGLRGKDHSVSTIPIKSKSIRGRHPKRVLMDDPVTEDDVSEATRLFVQRIYNELHKLTSNVGVIGQPAHQHDLYATLRPLLKKMEIPHGSIPELDHDLEAQRLAGVDEASIQASYHLKILTEGTTPFDKIRYVDKFPTGDSAVAFIDPSFEGGDYTALTILRMYMGGVAIQGHVYKKAWNHCLDEICQQLAKRAVKKLAFETNSLGDQPILMLRELLTPYGIGVTGKRSNTNKHSRIMAAGSYAHLIHLSRESDRTYTKQVVEYEYKAKFDDAPDSLASGLEWIGLIRGKI